MADTESCGVVNLGYGTTPNSPCTTIGIDPFSVQWCTAYDVVRLNDVVRVERNHLVRLLNEFIALLNEGKAQWDARTRMANELEVEALDLTHQIPSTWTGVAVALNYTPAQAAVALALMAQKVHAASCGVEQVLTELGVKLPPPPVVGKEPDSIMDATTNVAKKAAEGVAWIAGGAVVAALAWGFIANRRR